MFIRVKISAGRKYMQVVETTKKQGIFRQQHLWSMGKYDQAIYLRAKYLLRNWEALKRSQVVIDEIEDPNLPYWQK